MIEFAHDFLYDKETFGFTMLVFGPGVFMWIFAYFTMEW